MEVTRGVKEEYNKNLIAWGNVLKVKLESLKRIGT